MSKYIYSLLIISVVGGLINSIVSSFGTRKYINYFINLLVVLCLLAPLTSTLKNITNIKENIKSFLVNDSIQETIDDSNNLIINTGLEAISEGIKNEIINKYNFDTKEVIVEIEGDSTNIEAVKIKKIKVILTGKASWTDVDAVKAFLDNMIGGNIVVIRR